MVPGPLINDDRVSEDEEGSIRVGDIYIPPPIPPYCSIENKGERLIISQITNNNFKSFKGEVVLGPFHHCFTSIVGPNGSGKSNVIDAMLFVFGYRGNKMRSKNLSSLIHKSSKYPNIQSCSVAVHFHLICDLENRECDTIPNSEIVIERVAFADNTSYYLINNRRVQFKDVSKLLKQHHIDLDHNRFLILQGEVESIALMKPKGEKKNEYGLLEFIEDIIGTTRYKEPLIKLYDCLERLNDEQRVKRNRFKLSEREMKDLEKPYQKAIQFLKFENENIRTKNLLIQKILSEKKQKLSEYLHAQQTVETEIKAYDDLTDKLKKQRKEYEEFMRSNLVEYDELCKNNEEFEKNLEKINITITEVQENRTYIIKSLNENKSQLENEKEKLINLKVIPEIKQKEIAECQTKVDILKKQKYKNEEELEKIYAIYNKKIAPWTEKREIYQTDMVRLESLVNSAKAALSIVEQEMKILLENEITETRKYESMKLAFEESQKNLNSKKEDAKNISLKLIEIQKEETAKCDELAKLEDEEKRMRESLLILRNEIHENEKLMQASRSSNKVQNCLMRQKIEGNIPGILGRLGDLGAIDAMYDVAISTACGRLDHIVVDTVQTAQKCIEYLKEHNIGRASFIALEKVHFWANSSASIKTPEGVPRLYDLIKVEDERVLPAFYFALRNTLVATDLEQGTRIAYGIQRYRVVTLNGDLIEISGTMSGGGNMQIRGKMGTKVQINTKNTEDNSIMTQKRLDEMQKVAEDMQSKINYNQEQQGQVEKDMQNLKQNYKNLQNELYKLNVSIKSFEEQLPRILKRLEQNKDYLKQIKTDAAKVEMLEAEITQKANHLKESEHAAKSVLEKIHEIDTLIDETGNETIKPIKSKIESIQIQIDKLHTNISKLSSEINSAPRDQLKCIQEINQLQSNITKANEDIDKLSIQGENLRKELEDLNKKIEQTKQTIENVQISNSKVKEKLLIIEKQENDGKFKRIEFEDKLQAIKAKLIEINGQIQHLVEKLQTLVLNKIPGEKEAEAPLKEYTEIELMSHILQNIQTMAQSQEEMLKQKPNLGIIDEYIEKHEIYLERVKILKNVTLERDEMRKLYDDIRNRHFREFMHGFSIITQKLKEMYQMITQGGDADIELVDSMDFTEGLLFSVRPPRKSWKNITNLSGGEKTLSSLALIFALHYYKPSPLYLMDEIDAALDFRNTTIMAYHIREQTKNAQFIIISLRPEMYDLSDISVGINKVFDCSGSLPLKTRTKLLNKSKDEVEK